MSITKPELVKQKYQKWENVMIQFPNLEKNSFIFSLWCFHFLPHLVSFSKFVDFAICSFVLLTPLAFFHLWQLLVCLIGLVILAEYAK